MPCEECPDNQPIIVPSLPPTLPCKDCPEYIPPRDGSRKIVVIVYTGGPPYALFANVIRALTPDQNGIITKWNCPIVHSKGEIEYQENNTKPPTIEGYEYDISNPNLLRPIWPHCIWRILRVWREDTGAVAISAGCLLPASGIPAYETLKLIQCQNCEARTT